MITEENLISILFQIGFIEQEEYEIVFSSFEEKLQFRYGKKRFFKTENCIFDIDYITKKIDFTCIGLKLNKESYFKTLSLDDMVGVFKTLDKEYKHELRIIKIKTLLNK